MREEASVEPFSTSFSGAGGLTIRLLPDTTLWPWRRWFSEQVRVTVSCCNLVSMSATTEPDRVVSAHQ